MIQLRWIIEQWQEFDEDAGAYLQKKGSPQLQSRECLNPDEFGLQRPIWGKWKPVPTEYVDI